MGKFYKKRSLIQPVFLLLHWYLNHFLLLLCSISWALNSFRTCPFFCSWLSLVDAAMMISWYEWNKARRSCYLSNGYGISYIAVVTIALPNAVVKGYLLSLSSCHRLATHRSRMCVVLLFDKKNWNSCQNCKGLSKTTHRGWNVLFGKYNLDWRLWTKLL